LATGFWGGESELQAQRQNDVHFEPKLDPNEVAVRRNRWKEAVDRSRRWNS
jgi:glycerol kinase